MSILEMLRSGVHIPATQPRPPERFVNSHQK